MWNEESPEGAIYTIKMKKLLIILFALGMSLQAMAQGLCERLFVVTDKTCYVAGERLCVRVDVLTSEGQPSPSAVAYVEIADQYQLATQAMVSLKQGQGWAEIPLPSRMHSGLYQLTAYTRALCNYSDSLFFRTQIGVINGEHLARRDFMRVSPLADYAQHYRPAAELITGNRYAPGSAIDVALPQSDAMGCAVTVERAGVHALQQPELLSPQAAGAKPVLTGANAYVPEYEGHIVHAKLEGVPNMLQNARLAIIGKSASLYDGQHGQEGDIRFYTRHLTGGMPVILEAFDHDGNDMPIQITSPFQAKLPASMPRLEVCCSQDELLARVNQARQTAAVSQYLQTDSLVHSISFMSSAPDYFYDLNEYTSMNDIREILLEFVRGVKRGKEFGRNVLFTYNPETREYSTWPALVLLDGMPVSDIDEILDYDAHLVRYVQIYSGRYTFGHACCQGIISFVTRKGRLSNYKLSSASHLLQYAFPQDHLVFANLTQGSHGTLLWQPAVQGTAYTFQAPSEPGQYQLTVQGRTPQGTPFRKYIAFEVR